MARSIGLLSWFDAELAAGAPVIPALGAACVANAWVDVVTGYRRQVWSRELRRRGTIGGTTSKHAAE